MPTLGGGIGGRRTPSGSQLGDVLAYSEDVDDDEPAIAADDREPVQSEIIAADGEAAREFSEQEAERTDYGQDVEEHQELWEVDQQEPAETVDDVGEGEAAAEVVQAYAEPQQEPQEHPTQEQEIEYEEAEVHDTMDQNADEPETVDQEERIDWSQEHHEQQVAPPEVTVNSSNVAEEAPQVLETGTENVAAPATQSEDVPGASQSEHVSNAAANENEVGTALHSGHPQESGAANDGVENTHGARGGIPQDGPGNAPNHAAGQDANLMAAGANVADANAAMVANETPAAATARDGVTGAIALLGMVPNAGVLASVQAEIAQLSAEHALWQGADLQAGTLNFTTDALDAALGQFVADADQVVEAMQRSLTRSSALPWLAVGVMAGMAFEANRRRRKLSRLVHGAVSLAADSTLSWVPGMPSSFSEGDA